MAEPLLLRRAVPTDLQELTRVVEAAYAPFAHLDLPPVADGLGEDIRDHLVWIAELEGVMIGGIVVMMSNPPRIANLAVDPGAKGQGVGRRLVERAVMAAQDVGDQQITLTTHKDMAQTRAFYDRLGWEVTGQDSNKIYMAYDIEKKGTP